MRNISRHHISDEVILETYDRLATKWALKMEAHKAHKSLLARHPKLIINFRKASAKS